MTEVFNLIKNIFNLMMGLSPLYKGLFFVLFLLVAFMLLFFSNYLISGLHTELPTEMVEKLLPSPSEVEQVVESVGVSSPKGNSVDSSYLYISLAVISVVLICGGGFLYYMYGGGNPAEIVLEARPEVVAQPAVAEAAAQVGVQVAQNIGPVLSVDALNLFLGEIKYLADNAVAISEAQTMVSLGSISEDLMLFLEDAAKGVEVSNSFIKMLKDLYMVRPQISSWLPESTFSQLSKIDQDVLVSLLKQEFPNIDLPSFMRRP